MLDHRRNNILNYLLDYRAMNAKQMAAFIYMTPLFTTSNLKQVQRELKELIDKNLVTKFLYDENVVDEEGIIKKQKVSMYYLSKNGYTYMLEYFDVLQGQQGSGFLLDDNFIYGDISYETYSPPQKLFEHHLMAIDAFIQLSVQSSVTGKIIPHRNNLYAAKRFGKKRLRPDAEALINGDIYFLEFDRYTENHEKLVEKFETYAAYFDTLSGEEKVKLGKIIFVVHESNGKKRQWNNVLSAYLKGIGQYVSVPLVMCDMSELNMILKYESELELIKKDVQNYFVTQDKANLIWSYKSKNVVSVINNNQIQLVAFLFQYDSSIFNWLKFVSDKIHEENLKLNKSALLISPSKLYKWKLNLEHYKVPQIYIEQYKYYENHMDKKIIRYPSMVLDEIRIDALEDDYIY